MYFILYIFLSVIDLVCPAPVDEPDLHLRNVKNKQGGPYKRGLPFNDPQVTKFFQDANSKVSWMYNWYSTVDDAAGSYEFVPMLWSDAKSQTDIWGKNMDFWVHVGPGTTHALSFNEPDQCGNGGSCMLDVAKTVQAHRDFMEPLRKYGGKVRIISPAVTNGGGGMGITYLKRFLDGCNGCQIDAVACHWYEKATNIEYFKKHIQDVHDATGRPVWITEFGPAGNEAEVINFLHAVLPWLDQQDWIERYAMFWAASGYLLNPAGNGLSEVGRVYNTY